MDARDNGKDAMTTTGFMLKALTRAPLRVLSTGTLVACASLALVAGCSSKPELTAPETTVSPYGATGPNRPVFAIAPLRNESGVSVVDTLRISDALAARCAEVHDLSCLPVNRTLAAMRALGMPEVRSPEDARRLAMAVGADAIIVGSITAYDPYDPPKLGLTLGLYAREGSSITRRPSAATDPKSIQLQPDETRWTGGAFANQPLSVISEMLDAANHEVLMNVQRYAEGRHDSASALGWKRYVKSMDLYTDFAAYWSVYRLMNQERLRLAREPAPQKTAPK